MLACCQNVLEDVCSCADCETKQHSRQLHNCIARVWHDTLRSLRAIKTKSSSKAAIRDKAIIDWRKLGKECNLKEGKNVTTLQVVSTPSTLPYRKIPRRCFWAACGCSTHDAPHHLRVCKGCWRVLYCSAKCQSLCVVSTFCGALLTSHCTGIGRRGIAICVIVQVCSA